MRIKLTRNTVVGGKPVAAGKTIDASDRDGRYLVELGKAVSLEQKPKQETAATKPAENAAKPKPETKTAN